MTHRGPGEAARARPAPTISVAHRAPRRAGSMSRFSGTHAAAIVVAAAALLLALSSPAAAASRTVQFRAADGRTVTALLNEANRRPAPAVLLLPMMGRPKDDWQAVAQRLADAGITALAIDLPGSGVPADGPELTTWTVDIGSAVSYLTSRDVGATAVGIAGASLGASLAVYTAAGDGRVRAVALVSPAADYRGVRIAAPLKQILGRPVFMLASHEDPYSARSIRELSKGNETAYETAWSQIPAHGTTLLAREPDLVRMLVEWFQRVLG